MNRRMQWLLVWIPAIYLLGRIAPVLLTRAGLLPFLPE